LAVSIGEPAGIGPEIILRAWHERRLRKLPPFLVIGDAALLARRAHALGLPVSTTALQRGDFPSPFASALPVIAISRAMKGEPAKPDKEDASSVIEAIEIGCDMAMSGEAAALVTCPIAKSLLYEAGFGFPGHTEFLADFTERKSGDKVRPVMMIAGPELRTIPVTIHLPLAMVAQSLTRDLIVETVSIAASDLQRRFGLVSPRFAICGLNPHAGEKGALGREEIETIEPAIRELQSLGISASGPHSADTLFHRKARGSYDVAVCMYHDQALIPAKTLAFDDGVNVTLGLPFIRTSPDHGTAFDIAAQGNADPSSFCAALRMADEMAACAAPARGR
jgi:4-hydroxythreonine-4-phosphate dehydrogenase